MTDVPETRKLFSSSHIYGAGPFPCPAFFSLHTKFNSVFLNVEPLLTFVYNIQENSVEGSLPVIDRMPVPVKAHDIHRDDEDD